MIVELRIRNWIFQESPLDIPFQQVNGPGLTVRVTCLVYMA
jgi:hypothetical protein